MGSTLDCSLEGASKNVVSMNAQTLSMGDAKGLETALQLAGKVGACVEQ